MSAPVMGALATPANLLASQSLAASKAIGAFLDLSAVFEGHILVSVTTGGTAASTSGVTVAAYEIIEATTTLNQGSTLTAGATSATVTSTVGMYKGQKIVIVDELSTISAISTNTLTIGATQRNHNDGSIVAIIPQTFTAGGITLGMNLTAANTTYSMVLPLMTGYWFLYMTNTDASNAVTVEMTNRNVTGVQ